MRKQKRKHIMSETDTGNTQIDKRVECVVLPGDRRSGISCDWANATKETDNIELAIPCPNCQSRLTLSIRRTPLIGFHAVRLACENGQTGARSFLRK